MAEAKEKADAAKRKAEKEAENEAAAARKKAKAEAAAARQKAEEEAAAAKKKAEAEAKAAAARRKAEKEAAAAKRKAEEEATAAKKMLEAEEEAAEAKRKAEEEAAAAKRKAEEEAAAAKKMLEAEEEAAAAKKTLEAEEEAAANQIDDIFKDCDCKTKLIQNAGTCNIYDFKMCTKCDVKTCALKEVVSSFFCTQINCTPFSTTPIPVTTEIPPEPTNSDTPWIVISIVILVSLAILMGVVFAIVKIRKTLRAQDIEANVSFNSATSEVVLYSRSNEGLDNDNFSID